MWSRWSYGSLRSLVSRCLPAWETVPSDWLTRAVIGYPDCDGWLHAWWRASNVPIPERQRTMSCYLLARCCFYEWKEILSSSNQTVESRLGAIFQNDGCCSLLVGLDFRVPADLPLCPSVSRSFILQIYIYSVFAEGGAWKKIANINHSSFL